MKHIIIATMFAGIILATPMHNVLAHGGGLNQDGCHHETATGGYHCHRDQDDTGEQALRLLGVLAGGALVIWILTSLIEDDKASAFYLHSTEAGTTDLGYSLGTAGEIGIRTMTSPEDVKNAYIGVFWRSRF